jgi:neutral ceramidase
MSLPIRVSTPLLLLAVLAVCPAGAAEPGADKDAWKAGVAAVVITPEESIWMAGYGARTKPAEGRLQHLYAKALALEDPAGKRLVLVTTDLVGLRGQFTASIAAELKQKHGLSRDQVLFTSSHTHCGPLLSDDLDSDPWYPVTPKDEEKVRRYTQTLRGQLVEVIRQALADLKPARLSSGIGKAGFAVNRREPTPKGIINGTNAKGPVDHDVPVLRVESPDGKLRAVAFGYACHNTTLGDYLWCGDYAGYAQEYLEKAHAGVTALFFMGCGGDANPLPRRTVELCQQYGRQLAEAVEMVLQGQMRLITGEAQAVFGEVELTLAKLPTKEELEEQAKSKPLYQQRRAVMLLKVLEKNGKFATTYPYPVQVWQLGPQLTWVALGGEAVVDYAHRLKRELGAGTWVASYANDVMAYIPSQRVLQEGGYEATITSGELAGSCWGANVEERIVQKVRELVAQVRGQ